jgi:hypothetical protein
MIVEDHNPSDRLTALRGISELEREDSFASSRRCVSSHSIGSNCHHLFLKRSKIEISQNVKFLVRPWCTSVD